MGYFISVLGTSDPDIHIDDLKKSLQEEGLDANFTIDENETNALWSAFQLTNLQDEMMANVERYSTDEGSIGYEELQEIREDVNEYEPASAAEWLSNYLDKVKVIYSIQLLGTDHSDKYYRIISAVKEAIWNKTGGILHAYNEGYSNEDGAHILWQFSEDVKGKWNCAVLVDGNWKQFTMDLGNSKQRKQFLEGKVPKKWFWQ